VRMHEPDTGLGDHSEQLQRVLVDLGHEAAIVEVRGSVSAVVSPGQRPVDAALLQWVPHHWGRGGWAPGGARVPCRLQARRVPVVTVLHELYEDVHWTDPKRLARCLVQRGEFLLVTRCSQICVTTNDHYLTECSRWGIAAQRIPVGSVLAYQRGEVVPAPLRNEEGEAVASDVLWFGTLNEDDRLDVLTAALARLNASCGHRHRLLVAGMVPPHRQQAMASALRPMAERVVQLGWVSRAELAWLLEHCGCYAFTLASGPSGRRSSFAAAVAREAPIVAMRGPQGGGVIERERLCTLVDAHPAAWARALGGLLHHERVRADARAAARRAQAWYGLQAVRDGFVTARHNADGSRWLWAIAPRTPVC